MSFIIPAYQAERTLADTVASVRQAAPPGSEVIVVDDGSIDATAEHAAQLADRVVTRPCQGGAARSRNDGVRASRGKVLFFVDSDVTVSTFAVAGALCRLDEGFDAVFGAYEALPPPEVRNTATTFKNLIHHYTHLQGCGEAHTFWSGFGAVTRAAFLAVGGFDTSVTKAADVEDIHLGYRLSAAGFRIYLDPSLQVRHHKRYTVRGVIESDVLHRAVPWTRAMLKLKVFGGGLSLRAGALASMALAPAVVAAAVSSLILGPVALVAAAAFLAAWLLGSWHFLRYARAHWDLRGTVASAALLFLFHVYSPLGAAAGVVAQFLRKGRAARINWLDLEVVGDRSEVDVTVVVVDYHGDAAATLAALPAPAAWWELIVVGPMAPDPLPTNARWIRGPADAPLLSMAQRAVRHARGEMFAVLDASIVPGDGWLGRVRASAQRTEFLIGGSFDHDRRSIQARAHQVGRYWRWRPERAASWMYDHPFTNMAIRTEVARAVGLTGAVILRLTRFGARPVRFDPEMRVRPIAHPRGLHLLRTVAGAGRLRTAAATRYYDLGRLHRFGAALLTPLYAARDIASIATSATREGTADVTFWLAMPVTAQAVASHWLGRALGSLSPGDRGGIALRTVQELSTLTGEQAVGRGRVTSDR